MTCTNVISLKVIFCEITISQPNTFPEKLREYTVHYWIVFINPNLRYQGEPYSTTSLWLIVIPLEELEKGCVGPHLWRQNDSLGSVVIAASSFWDASAL